MLDIRVTIENDKVVIAGLKALGPKINKAVQRGLTRAGAGIYAEAFKWLSGHGAKGTSQYRTSKSGNAYLKWTRRSEAIPAGGRQVPIRTGHLRNLLGWLKPGETKMSSDKAGCQKPLSASENLTFTAALNEAIIYDAASYADAIFSGKGTSEKYGPRDALKDGLEVFNRGAHILQILEEEIQKDIENVG